MKKLFAIALVLTAVTFVSCAKEEVPAPYAPVRTVTVEYRIFAQSGHVSLDYLEPENGVLVAKQAQLDRLNTTITFQHNSGNTFSVKAWNTISSGKEVKAEIYIDGVLFKTGSANAPGAVAIAEGKY
jgi:hypothetical protein